MNMAKKTKVEGLLPSIEVAWPNRNGPFILGLHFGLLRGRYECIGLEIRPIGTEGLDVLRPRPASAAPISSALLRTVPLGTVLDRERKTMLEFAREVIRSGDDKDRQLAVEEHVRWAEGRGGRPVDLVKDRLREVARVYQAAYEQRQPPTLTVAEQFHLSRSAAAKQVSRAREAGFLPKTTKGKPAGGRRS